MWTNLNQVTTCFLESLYSQHIGSGVDVRTVSACFHTHMLLKLGHTCSGAMTETHQILQGESCIPDLGIHNMHSSSQHVLSNLFVWFWNSHNILPLKTLYHGVFDDKLMCLHVHQDSNYLVSISTVPWKVCSGLFAICISVLGKVWSTNLLKHQHTSGH